MTSQSQCPTCGSIIPIEWVCNWVICKCNHGGKSWHDKIFGKCTYGHCKCNRLIPKDAVVHPIHDKDKFRFISGNDFVKILRQSKGEITVEC